MTLQELFASVPDLEVSSVLAFIGAIIVGYVLIQIGFLLIFWWIDRRDRNWPRWP